MTHLPTTFRDVTYRMFLLRRLTLVCSALLWLGMGVASWISGGAMPWNDAPMAWGLGALALVALHNVTFPSGCLDILAGSLAGAAVLAGSHLFVGKFQLQPVLVTSLMLLAWFALTLMTVSTLAGLAGLGRKMRELQNEDRLPVPADALQQVMFIHPDQTRGQAWTGPVDAHGFFPVHFGYAFPDPDTFEMPDVPSAKPDCYVRIDHEGPDFQLTQWQIAGPGGEMTKHGSVSHLTIRADGPDACVLTEIERHDAWDMMTMIAGWLNDHRRDYLRDKVDAARGSRTHAVRACPQVTALTLLARFFKRTEFKTPDGSPLN